MHKLSDTLAISKAEIQIKGVEDHTLPVSLQGSMVYSVCKVAFILILGTNMKLSVSMFEVMAGADMLRPEGYHVKVNGSVSIGLRIRLQKCYPAYS